jgi:hypothetical protein
MIDAEVQESLYETLVTALTGVATVYDAVPQGATYPYVVIDSQEIVPFDPFNSRRDERFVYLSVWSQYRGQKEVLNILSLIDSALHRKKLPIDEGRIAMVYVTDKRTMREPDNLTFQGAIKVRLITEH